MDGTDREHNVVKQTKKYSLDYFLFIFCFFPYLTFIPIIRTDTQPYALLVSMLFLLVSPPKKVPKPFLFLLLMLLVSVSLIAISGLNITALRSFLGYLSLFLITYATYRATNRSKDASEKILEFAVYAWLIVGLVQVIYPNFLGFVLPRVSTSDTRGVVSLAPEPSYYGISCMFMLMLTHILGLKEKKKLSILLIFQILFLAQSAMVIIFLIVYYGAQWILSFNLKKVGLTAVFLIVVLLTFSNMDFANYNSRSLKILLSIIDNGAYKLLLIDASINDRVSHIFFSFKGFWENYLLPNGFTTWEPYLKRVVPMYKHIFFNVSIGDKIMSAYGAAFYELGIFGLGFPIVVNYYIWSVYRKNLQVMLRFLVTVNLILFTAIPLSYPLIAVLVGHLANIDRRLLKQRMSKESDV